jgi:hypothetical protein
MRGREKRRRLPPAYKSSNLPVSRSAPPYRSNSTQASDFRTYVLYSILGLGTAAGLTYLGVKVVKKAMQDSRRANAERDSLDPGAAANMAKRLKMAFENDNWAGWGTDEDRIYAVFREIPDRDFYRRVQQQYLSMYGSELNSDMADELTSEEYNQVQRILNDNERQNAGK